MYPELTNLLPHERKRQMRRDYFYRLGTLAALALISVLIVHAALLYPAYRYLGQEITARTASIAALQSSLASTNEEQLDARLSELSEQTAALSALATSTPQSGTLVELLALAHPGVRITGISLAAAQGQTPASGSISGTADTRDDLRAYYLALSNTPLISAADLPVSAYASAADIPFTVTLTFAAPSP